MKKRVISSMLSVMIVIGLLVGCGSNQDQNAGNSSASDKSTTAIAASTVDNSIKSLGKLIVSYSGGTCEAPTFVAYHKGFFEDEGLDIELVKMDFETLKSGIASGKVDATVGNFAWFKAIEQGLGIKLTGGLHAGCIQAVTPPDSGIRSIKDLKGKTIGVEAIGGGPMIILSSELQKLGIDPKKDVSWKAYPDAQLQTAAEKKEVDAFIVWDPFTQRAIDEKKYTRLLSISHDEPYKSGFCCYSVVSNELVENNKEKAAAFTRAVLKAAEWVGNNPDEASKLEIDNKYVATDLNANTLSIKSYYWKPSVKKAAENAKFFIHEEKVQGILDVSTDENELYKNLFAEVTDYKDNE